MLSCEARSVSHVLHQVFLLAKEVLQSHQRHVHATTLEEVICSVIISV